MLKNIVILLDRPMEALHKLPILVPSREEPVGTHHPVVLLTHCLAHCYTVSKARIGKNIGCQSKNGTGGRARWHGIDMPQLICIPPCLVGFAFCETKNKAIILPRNVEEVSKNDALQLCHKVPLQCQKQQANRYSLPSSFNNSSHIFAQTLKSIFF
jgi:hypothetical protein